MQYEPTPAFSAEAYAALSAENFGEVLASANGTGHERADQLMVELIYGAR